MALSQWLNGDLFSALRDKVNASFTAVDTIYPNTSAYYQDYSTGVFEPTITGSNITIDYCKYSYIKTGTSLVHLRLYIGFDAAAGNLGYGDLVIILPDKSLASKLMLPCVYSDNSSGQTTNISSDTNGDLTTTFDSGLITLGQHIVTINVTYELQ